MGGNEMSAESQGWGIELEVDDEILPLHDGVAVSMVWCPEGSMTPT
jgi:hypothetical protein